MNKSLRDRVFAEFRGYWEPKVKADRAQPVGPMVQSIVQKLGLTEQMDEEELRRVWKEIVGEFLATHSTPVRLRDGILVVQVIQPTVHYELDRIWKPKVLKKLKERFGPRKIREIRFRV